MAPYVVNAVGRLSIGIGKRDTDQDAAAFDEYRDPIVLELYTTALVKAPFTLVPFKLTVADASKV